MTMTKIPPRQLATQEGTNVHFSNVHFCSLPELWPFTASCLPYMLSLPPPPIAWRQIWRVAGRESGSPELLGSPRTSPGSSPNFPGSFFGDFPGSSLTVELNSNPEVPRKFPRLPRKFPKLPRKFPDFPGGQPLSLGSLTPSPDSQNLSLNCFHTK